MPVYSSRGTTFSADCGAGDSFGLSVFLRDGNDVYRAYFTSDRESTGSGWTSTCWT